MQPHPIDLPPHSIEAEHAVLGGILIDGDAIHQAGALREGDFYHSDHRVIFAAIRALLDAGKPIDIVTVAEALEARGTLEKAGGLPYLRTLAENTPSAANVAAYAEAVRERARLRYLLVALDDGRQMVEERGVRKAADVLADVQSRLESIAHANAGESLGLAEVLSCTMDAVKSAVERRRAGGVVGVPTGMMALDERTGGIHGPRLWIVAGRPSLGKTALTLQWALHAAGKGHSVGIVSLEMGAEEIGFRALASRLGLNAAAMAHGDGHEFEQLKSMAAGSGLATLRDLRVVFDFEAVTLGAIVSRITEWRRTHRIDYAIVDHVGLIEAEGFNTRTDQLGHISRTLKKLAKRLDMPIVVVSQLNRLVERDKRRPVLSDLRDSGNLEQDADVVLMLHASSEDEHRSRSACSRTALVSRAGWSSGTCSTDASRPSAS